MNFFVSKSQVLGIRVVFQIYKIMFDVSCYVVMVMEVH